MRAIASRGYEKQYGARPLKRVLQREVEDPLAEKLLVGEFVKGDTVDVKADAQGRIYFERGRR